jgi:hypothetical protein
VLDRGAHPGALQAAHVGDADPRREQRVLAEVLEVAAAVGRAMQVDGGREQHVDALAAALRGEQVAEALDARLVPGRGQRGRRRDVGRRVALVPALAAHAHRPVRRDEPPQPGRRLLVQGP